MQRRNGFRSNILLTFLFLYLPFLWNSAFVHPRMTVDLSAFYWAANVTYHVHASPYDPQLVAKTLEPPRAKRWPQTPFLYPPASLPLFFPLALASYHSIQIAMLVLNQLCVLFLLYFFLFHLLRDGDDFVRIFVIIYVFNFQPIIGTIRAGQINLLVSVLICLVWLGLKRNWKNFSMAIPLAAASLLKTYPVALASLLFLSKRYRAFFWFCAIVSVVCALSFCVLPELTWADWFHFVLPSGMYGRTPAGLLSIASPWNQSINAFTSRLFLKSDFTEPLLANNLASRVVPAIFSILIAVLTFFQIKRSRNVEYQFSVSLLTLFLIVPLAWEATMVLLLPAIVFAFSHFDQEILPSKVVIALSAFLIAWPVPIYAMSLRNGFSVLFISMKFYGVLLLWLFYIMKMAHTIRTFVEKPEIELVEVGGLVNNFAADHSF